LKEQLTSSRTLLAQRLMQDSGLRTPTFPRDCRLLRAPTSIRCAKSNLPTRHFPTSRSWVGMLTPPHPVSRNKYFCYRTRNIHARPVPDAPHQSDATPRCPPRLMGFLEDHLDAIPRLQLVRMVAFPCRSRRLSVKALKQCRSPNTTSLPHQFLLPTTRSSRRGVPYQHGETTCAICTYIWGYSAS
jgi:hypothetical protein